MAKYPGPPHPRGDIRNEIYTHQILDIPLHHRKGLRGTCEQSSTDVFSQLVYLLIEPCESLISISFAPA